MIEVFLEYRGRAVSRSSGYFGRTPDRDRLRFRPCRPRGTTWWEANQRGRQAGSVTRSSYSDSRPRSGAVSAVVRGRTARRATAAATGLVLRGRERRGVIAAMTASRAVWDGVAPLPWHGDQGERRAATGRVDEVGGVVLVTRSRPASAMRWMLRARTSAAAPAAGGDAPGRGSPYMSELQGRVGQAEADARSQPARRSATGSALGRRAVLLVRPHDHCCGSQQHTGPGGRGAAAGTPSPLSRSG